MKTDIKWSKEIRVTTIDIAKLEAQEEIAKRNMKINLHFGCTIILFSPTVVIFSFFS